MTQSLRNFLRFDFALSKRLLYSVMLLDGCNICSDGSVPRSSNQSSQSGTEACTPGRPPSTATVDTYEWIE